MMNESIGWECLELKIIKYNTLKSYELKIPDEVTTVKGNLVTVKGMQCLWRCITGVAADGTEWVPYSLANMHIGVGNGESAATTTDTILNGAQTSYQPVESIIYDEEGSTSSASITATTTFGVGVASWSWNEWGIFNGDPSTSETPENIIMLNHKIESMGTKSAQATWVMQAVLRLKNITSVGI